MRTDLSEINWTRELHKRNDSINEQWTFIKETVNNTIKNIYLGEQ